MRVLITGAGGQVGRALVASVPAGATVRALTHAELDIADERAVRQALQSFAPKIVLNAAAYTGVDKAESDANAAHAINALGPRHLAAATAALVDCRLVHISTDFVFDGCASRPYSPDAPAAPLGVYGHSKLAGELAVREVLGDSALIVRTAWVYAAEGRNFLTTMLRLMNDKGTVRVVADQVGTPTAAKSLAAVLWRLAEDRAARGVLHWTDGGVASWYDFAVAIAEEGASAGIVAPGVDVTPIATADYPTPARRPSYSVLDKTSTSRLLGVVPVHWRRSLRAVIQERSKANA